MNQAIAGVVGLENEVEVTIVYPSISALQLGKFFGTLFNLPVIGFPIALGFAPICASMYLGRLVVGKRVRVTSRQIVLENALRGGTAHNTISLDSFDSITIKQQSGQHWYNSGDLHFMTGDQTAGVISDISHPEAFRVMCLKAQESFVGVKEAIS